MDILLINSNPVVRRLIELCAKQISVEIDTATTVSLEDLSRYRVVIIDDNSLNLEIKSVLESTHLGYRVLLVSKSFDKQSLVIFDEVLKKPFLPSKIIDIIYNAPEIKPPVVEKEVVVESLVDDISNENETIEREDDFVFDDVLFEIPTTTNSDDADTQILDKGELEKIKELLDTEVKSSSVSKSKKYKKALKELIDDALDRAIERVGKESFKEAVKDGRVSVKFKIEKE
jgi:hypothetical protein